MGYHKILVPFTGSDRYAGMLPTAMSIGDQFNAYCEILFIRPEPYQALPYLGDAAPGVVVKEIVERANEAADSSVKKLQSALEKAAKDAGAQLVDQTVPAGKFCTRLVERSGETIEVATRRSRLCDLVLFVGGEGHGEVAVSLALTAVLMKTGRPVLILPGTNYKGSIGNNIVIAWDGSIEAANAVKGAIPFLKRASSIKIFNVQRNIEEAGVDTGFAEAVGEYLDLLGLKHTEAIIDAEAKGVAQTLLEKASEHEADLLVMGGYGHSRVRELILGGVTQHILNHTTIPVLLAH
ncbi:MAG: universal stress protein [Alphaproteobacteria bacterium]|nr:MAG: universal stress protein [Alphaproteobacteria bacterium]